MYEVLIRSENTLSVAGPHPFDDSPIERAEVSFNGEQWIVDDVDERYSPAQVTLVRRP
jgi:hypothetical protein